jgi:putative FmdB family regulatory protein
MKILFDFECKDCGVFDKIIEYTTTTDCPTCGKESKKLISSPNIMLEGWSGDFPKAHLAWEKKHWQDVRQKEKKASKG